MQAVQFGCTLTLDNAFPFAALICIAILVWDLTLERLISV